MNVHVHQVRENRARSFRQFHQVPFMRLQDFLQAEGPGNQNSEIGMNPFSAGFELRFPDAIKARAAAKAVSPELRNSYEKRSKTSINANKNVVSLKVIASDESALKASMSSYSRLLGLCLKLSKQ